MAGLPLVDVLALRPLGAGFEPWQLVTYAFLHASVVHIALNMWGLVLFGSDLECAWGGRTLVQYYFVAVVSAAITQLVFASLTHSVTPTVGASGGVFGLLLAFALTYPRRELMLILPPIVVSARTFAIGYAALELTLGVTGTEAGVAHFAHLGGMAGGYVYLRAIQRRAL